MNGYGVAVIVLVAVLLIGLAVMVVAGSIAVTRHPDRFDNERNAARYVKPAMLGGLATIVAMLGLVLTAVVGIVDWLT